MRRWHISIPAFMLLISFGCCCPETSVNTAYSSPATANTGWQEIKHPEFTRNSITRIRQGMTVEEMERLFGSPDRSHEREMGLTKVLIYEYDMARNPHYSHQFDISNTFYFGVDQDPPYLKKWEIDYVHSVRYMVPAGRVPAGEGRYETTGDPRIERGPSVYLE